MPLTGKLVADFGTFLDAVDKSTVKLADFSKGASGVEAKLNKMTDGFSGRSVIQEASLMTIAIEKAGGVSTLTAKQLEIVGNKANEAAEKLQKLGIDVPPGLQKIADEATKAKGAMEGLGSNLDIKGLIEDPIGHAKEGMVAFGESIGPVGIAAVGLAAGVLAVGAALFELTRNAAEAGGKLNDIGEVTGIAVPQLSRLSNASSIAGTDIQTLSNAVFMMQKNMAESPDKFEKGLERININVADFKALAPDQQLLALAGALKSTEDPVQRNAAGFELMGRQFRDLAPALYKMNEALEATADIQPWTDEQAKKAEAFDMQLQSIKIHAEAVGISLGRTLIEPLATLIGFFTSATGKLASFAGGFGGVLSPVGAAKGAFAFASAALETFGITAADTVKAVDLLALRQENLNKIFDAARTPDALVKKWKDSLSSLTPAAVSLNDALANQRDVIATLDPQTKTHIDTLNKAAAAQQKFLDSVKGFSFGTFVADTSKLNAVVPDLAQHAEDASEKFSAWRDEMSNLTSTANTFNSVDIETAAGVRKTVAAFSTLPNVIPLATKAIEDAGKAAETFGDRIEESLGKSLDKIPGEIAHAFTGGGGLSGGIKSIGTTVASGLGETLGKGISSLGKFGGPIGAAIGSLAGPLIGFFTNVFSGGAEHLINPIREAFVQAAGGLGALNEKAAAAGVTLSALLNAKDEEQYKKAIDDLNVAFANMKAKVDADTSALGLLLKSAQGIGATLPPALQDSISKLIELGKVTGDTKDLLATLSGGTTVSFATMRDIASKYGADLEALGPKFEAAKIGDTAAGIINDFDTLQRGLGDTDEALTILRKPINDLVNDSIKFGVAIPANMKPWVDQLEKTGQLTDENGDKLTDLGGLKFADPIKTQFDILIQSIKDLVDKISGAGGLNAAINGIPDKTVHVGFQVDNAPDLSGGDFSRAASGGLVTAFGVQRLAGGGRILPFPGSASGIDTVPIWAAAGEGVVNRRGMSTIGQAGLAALNNGSGLGGGTTVVDMQGLRDDLASVMQAQADAQRALPKQIRDAVLLAQRRVA